MANKVLRYEGEKILVTYDVKKCIHAAECIHGLRSVFDPAGKPWINPDRASPEEVATVIHRCPSGALQYERKDDGPPEPVPPKNTVEIRKDGPLYLRGDIELRDSEGTVMSAATRLALCRCGASSNKPYCDNSHNDANFTEAGRLGRGGVAVAETDEQGGPLVVTVVPDGFLRLEGRVDLISEDGEERTIAKATMCRCGASSNKPFCDSSHREIGFTS